jgi:DNA-binding NarL/FixJ family response regulator
VAQARSLTRDQDLLSRGGRIRTLYQHTLRHAPSLLARCEQLRGDAEARSLDEVTDRLIVVDSAIADRLGMNVRTARVHIAKLAATLGSESRTQLGYLIGRSGILDQEQDQEPSRER